MASFLVTSPILADKRYEVGEVIEVETEAEVEALKQCGAIADLPKAPAAKAETKPKGTAKPKEEGEA